MSFQMPTPPPPNPTDVLRGVGVVRQGRTFDLDPGRFPGMPLWAGHPPFQVISYRTPAGITNQGDQQWLHPENNPANVKIMSEVIIAGCHSGTHIDALAHVTCGPDNHWHGGASADTDLGDFGPLRDDASMIPIFMTRGVLVDVARHLGVDRLARGHGITREEFDGALAVTGLQLAAGDVVVIRTGQMRAWPDPAEWARTDGSGITLAVADLLLETGVQAIGSDTAAVECVPSGDPDNPHPVHTRVLVDAGRHLIENIYLEELAAAGVAEFLFVASAPRIAGATGSFVRPIAVV